MLAPVHNVDSKEPCYSGLRETNPPTPGLMSGRNDLKRSGPGNRADPIGQISFAKIF